MSRKSYPNVNTANQYARDVVRGKIVACQFVIQACQRHLDDLMAEKSKSFRYRFDKDLAERAAKFIQLLPHTKGEWAFKRMPITLEPWQLFVICCAFGWVNKGSRLRRFREVYTEIPRKNGKSAISAGVALYCFACDNEFGAEVYSGATTEKQAWEVFRPARLMCKRTPMLTEAFGIEVNASNMNRPEDGARFEPLIGNPGDGSSPHCAVVDEYHEHATDALYTTMLTGMGARRQPLMWAITTAGYNIEGPCYDKRREVIEMLNGSVPNDELFGIIYTVDEGDDWTDPQVLEKANPNIGVSVYREFLLSQQQRAKNNARLANVFKTKHLNIWVSARSAYFNLVSWQSCEDKSLTLEQFEGQPCILAFDLARKLDMNSMARLYTREIDGKTHYYSVAPRFWVPYDTVYSVEKNEDRRTAERFQKWVEMGVLTVTDGAEVDYRYILEEAKAANKISPVSESPIDPFGATGLSHDLADEDLNPITIIQNYTNMTAGDQFNQQHITLAGYEKETQTPADELAASRTARAAVFIRNDPARPTQTGELVGMLPAPKGKRFTMTEQQTLLSHGVATAYVESGVLRIQRDVTTYRKNAYGVADNSYLDSETLHTSAYVLRKLKSVITSKYGRHKLASDGTRFGPGQAIVTPAVIKGELLATYRQLERAGIVENYELFKQYLVVERDASDPNRLNTLFPPDYVNQLRVFAVVNQFRLQYSEESA
ncbi:TPA: hypothetical protein JLJ32_003187 [Escherichia coli]|nr:hypothetical protein [Escherichia coli]